MLLCSYVSITILRYVKVQSELYYNFYGVDIFINVRHIFETMFNYKNTLPRQEHCYRKYDKLKF